jgi:hypothetical protein
MLASWLQMQSLSDLMCVLQENVRQLADKEEMISVNSIIYAAIDDLEMQWKAC